MIHARFRGALLGVAVGDGLGAAFEGRRRVDPSAIDAVDQGTDVLRYTDDTHMTIGVAESLLECGGFDGDRMVRHLGARFTLEPWRGYGPGPPNIFRRVSEGVSWEQAAQEVYGRRGSFGNGGAMRITPVSLLSFWRPDETADLATKVASITHRHPLGVEGAVLQAIAVDRALRGMLGSAHDLVDELDPYIRSTVFGERLASMRSLPLDAEPHEVAHQLGNDVTAPGSVPAAVYAAIRNPESFEETVRFAISLGGDTDTIASMAGAMAGAHLGVEGIPPRWHARIEGRARLAQLADALFEAASRSPGS